MYPLLSKLLPHFIAVEKVARIFAKDVPKNKAPLVPLATAYEALSDPSWSVAGGGGAFEMEGSRFDWWGLVQQDYKGGAASSAAKAAAAKKKKKKAAVEDEELDDMDDDDEEDAPASAAAASKEEDGPYPASSVLPLRPLYDCRNDPKANKFPTDPMALVQSFEAMMGMAPKLRAPLYRYVVTLDPTVKKHIKFAIDFLREQPSPSLIHFMMGANSADKALQQIENGDKNAIKKALIRDTLRLAFYAMSNSDLLHSEDGEGGANKIVAKLKTAKIMENELGDGNAVVAKDAAKARRAVQKSTQKFLRDITRADQLFYFLEDEDVSNWTKVSEIYEKAREVAVAEVQELFIEHYDEGLKKFTAADGKADGAQVWKSLLEYVFATDQADLEDDQSKYPNYHLWNSQLQVKNVLNVPVPSMMMNGKLLLEESGFLDGASAESGEDEDEEGAMAAGGMDDEMGMMGGMGGMMGGMGGMGGGGGGRQAPKVYQNEQAMEQRVYMQAMMQRQRVGNAHKFLMKKFEPSSLLGGYHSLLTKEAAIAGKKKGGMQQPGGGQPGQPGGEGGEEGGKKKEDNWSEDKQRFVHFGDAAEALTPLFGVLANYADKEYYNFHYHVVYMSEKEHLYLADSFREVIADKENRVQYAIVYEKDLFKKYGKAFYQKAYETACPEVLQRNPYFHALDCGKYLKAGNGDAKKAKAAFLAEVEASMVAVAPAFEEHKRKKALAKSEEELLNEDAGEDEEDGAVAKKEEMKDDLLWWFNGRVIELPIDTDPVQAGHIVVLNQMGGNLFEFDGTTSTLPAAASADGETTEAVPMSVFNNTVIDGRIAEMNGVVADFLYQTKDSGQIDVKSEGHTSLRELVDVYISDQLKLPLLKADESVENAGSLAKIEVILNPLSETTQMLSSVLSWFDELFHTSIQMNIVLNPRASYEGNGSPITRFYREVGFLPGRDNKGVVFKAAKNNFLCTVNLKVLPTWLVQGSDHFQSKIYTRLNAPTEESRASSSGALVDDKRIQIANSIVDEGKCHGEWDEVTADYIIEKYEKRGGKVRVPGIQKGLKPGGGPPRGVHEYCLEKYSTAVANVAKHDIDTDNVQVSASALVDISSSPKRAHKTEMAEFGPMQAVNYVSATYKLKDMYIEGQAYVVDDSGYAYTTAQNLEFGIFESSAEEEEVEVPVDSEKGAAGGLKNVTGMAVVDTMRDDARVLKNMGYFQLRANPGIYQIKLLPKSRRDFKVSNALLQVDSYMAQSMRMKIRPKKIGALTKLMFGKRYNEKALNE